MVLGVGTHLDMKLRDDGCSNVVVEEIVVLGVGTHLDMKLRDGASSIADFRKTNHAAVSLIFSSSCRF